MMDIHMHLIPGVDDGAQSMGMALEMLKMAKEKGITHILCTPHSEVFRYSKEGGKIIFRRLADAAKRDFPEMKLYLGCEVFCEADRMDDVVEDIRSGRFPTMNGTQYVLLEFPMHVQFEDAVSCVKAVAEAGYKPVIAHAERYRYLRGSMELIEQFRKMGALIQINAYSLEDEKEDSIKDWARQLVTECKADFLGTDAHRTWHRPPEAKNGLKWLYENVERGYADAIAWKNASEYFDMY